MMPGGKLPVAGAGKRHPGPRVASDAFHVAAPLPSYLLPVPRDS